MPIKTIKPHFFTILLVIEILYLIVALMIAPLPGWKMFSRVEWVQQVVLQDDNGHEISMAGYLPKTHYDFDESTARGTAEFICRKHPEVKNWNLKIEGDSYELQASDCTARKK